LIVMKRKSKPCVSSRQNAQFKWNIHIGLCRIGLFPSAFNAYLRRDIHISP
jgi:hypothetical protein